MVIHSQKNSWGVWGHIVTSFCMSAAELTFQISTVDTKPSIKHRPWLLLLQDFSMNESDLDGFETTAKGIKRSQGTARLWGLEFRK